MTNHPPTTQANHTGGGKFYSRLLSNSGFNIAGTLLVFVVNFLSLPFIVRKLGGEAYGIYSLTGVVMGYFFFLDIGMSTSLIKFGAENRALGDDKSLSVMINTSAISNAVMGFVGAAILYAMAPFLCTRALKVSPEFAGSAIQVFRIASFSLFLSMVLSIFMSLPSALQKFFVSNLLKVVFGILNIAVIVVMLIAGMSLVQIMLASFGLIVLMIVVYVAVAVKLVKGYRPRLEFDRGVFSKMLGYGAVTLVQRLVSSLLTQIDRLLIGIFLPVSKVSLFVIPATFSSYVMRAPQAVLQPLFPMVAEIRKTHADPDSAIRTLYLRGSKYFLLYYIPFTVLAVLFARPILTHWVGAEIASGAWHVMQYLSTAYFVLSLQFVPSIIINGMGKPAANAWGQSAIGVINLVLCLVLIPRIGIDGAGIAILVSATVSTPFYIAWIQNRHLGVRMRDYAGQVLLRPALAAVSVTVPLALFAPRNPGLAALFAYCLAYTVAFFAACFVFGAFDSEDRSRLSSFCRSAISKLR